MYAELKESIEETHELSQKDHRGTSVQMTMCTAGKASNVIPGTASVVFNIRHTESYTETLLKNMCSHIITKHGGEVVSSGYGIMFNASDDDPTIVEYKEFAEKELGIELKLARTHGGTDGKKFAEK